MDIRTKVEAEKILEATESIRDSFPNDMPYLWDSLSPAIERIERSAHTILNRTTILVAVE